MALRSNNYLFSQMRKKPCPYWKVYNGKELIDKCDEKCDDVELQIAELKEALDSIEGTYKVILSIRPFSEKNEGGDIKNTTFTHHVKCSGYSINEDVMENNSPDFSHLENMYEKLLGMQSIIAEKNAELAKKEIELKNEQQIAELKRQIEDLKSALEEDDDEEDQDEFTDMIKPYIPMIAGMFGMKANAPMGMAGTENEESEIKVENTEKTPEQVMQNKKCANACIQLLKIDKNAGDNLMMLAEFATLSPESYFSFIPMLKGQLEFLKQK